jgi:hypothetical protein
MDTFITVSSFLAFYSIHNLYCSQGNKLSLGDILKLYLKRYLRFAPTVFAVFFFGVYVMPHIHGSPTNYAGDPIWYSFQEILFYRCTERPYMLAKLFFYSNLYPKF